jgi:hypothetical protein
MRHNYDTKVKSARRHHFLSASEHVVVTWYDFILLFLHYGFFPSIRSAGQTSPGVRPLASFGIGAHCAEVWVYGSHIYLFWAFFAYYSPLGKIGPPALRRETCGVAFRVEKKALHFVHIICHLQRALCTALQRGILRYTYICDLLYPSPSYLRCSRRNIYERVETAGLGSRPPPRVHGSNTKRAVLSNQSYVHTNRTIPQLCAALMA